MGSPEDRSKNETTPAGAKGRAEAVLRGEASPINKREHSAIRQVDAIQTRRSCVVKNIVISVALGASAIFASHAADAAPLTKGLAMLPNENIEYVRLVFDRPRTIIATALRPRRAVLIFSRVRITSLRSVPIDETADQPRKRLMLGTCLAFSEKVSELDFGRRSAGRHVGFV